MECVKNCRLCNKLILSQSITFTGGNLVVDLPANSYGNCVKYCIVFAQSIPDGATVNAPVVFTINGSTEQYPFLNRDCTPIYASQVRTRRVYPTRVATGVNDGVFKYIGDCCLPSNSTTLVQSIPVTTTATTTPATTNTEVARANVK